MAASSSPTSTNDAFIVRPMTSEDVATVEDWYSDICPTSIDLTIAHKVSSDLDFKSDRFLVGELDGKTIASKVEINVGGTVGYGSMFYVAEQHRKSGFGRRINDEACEISKRLGFVVGIDAHDELETMNHRRGYQTEFKVTQYQGQVNDQSTCAVGGIQLHEFTDSLFESVIKYDDQCFVCGGSEWRRRLLAHWVAIAGGRCMVATAASDDHVVVVGYGCRRPAKRHPANHLVGPLYADNLDIARYLVSSLTQDIIGQTVWINICEPNEGALELVKELKLTDSLHMLRMYRNKNDSRENTELRLLPSNKVFAITSIDVCGY